MLFVLSAAWGHDFFWGKVVSVAFFNKYKSFLIDVSMVIEIIVKSFVVNESLDPL